LKGDGVLTITEFSEKYGIDINIVRYASYHTPTRTRCSFKKDVPEDELRVAVLEDVERKIRFHQDKIEKAKTVAERIRNVHD
jgi:hypothetical protein